MARNERTVTLRNRVKSGLSLELHNCFIDATNEIRSRFGAANVGRFEFSVKCEGRTLTDANEVKIEYRLESGYDCQVKGNDLEACIVEVLRRHGWDETNSPLALSGPNRTRTTDEDGYEVEEAEDY
jgi:hypothetical protein